MGPILKINLTTSEISQFAIPHQWEEQYLGGASLGARLLYDRLVPGLDPLSPEAPMLFINGPLSGTAGPVVGRSVVCARSPQTGLWGESNFGGFWGAELGACGFSALWLEGRAESPIYLWIQDDKVEIRPASSLWGLDTYQTQTAIQAELGAGKISVAGIGLAGENLIPFALILTDHGRVAGRTGMGAVMGSKNLKALAVQGHGKVDVADPPTYLRLRSEANRLLRSENSSLVLRELGTGCAAEYFDYLGEMPKRYFQYESFTEDIRVSGAQMKDTILAGVSACHACVIACGRVVRLEEGQRRKGPEYETMIGFGSNLMLNDLPLATRLGELCDRYGMDTISLSNTIGLAFHLYETGKITLQDTGGLELTWGNSQVVEPLIHLTAQQAGFGAYLAQGALALGRRFDAESEAVQVNNLEVPFHDPRGSSGMALSYATSPRGACHNQSDYFMIDIYRALPSLGLDFYDRQGGAEKSRSVALHQDWRTVYNSLVMCLYNNLEPDLILPLVNAACGLDWSLEDLLRSGERGWNLKRAINNRLGLTRANDTLPKALLEPYQDATHLEAPFKIDLESMLETYYQTRGWDPVTGFPTPDKLRQLELDFVISDLY
jgi:aldehyde:ferredoxin oxidoreductase